VVNGYEQLAEETNDYQQLPDKLDEINKEYKMPAAGILTPTEAMNLGEKIKYAKQLVKTFSTNWSDNPAPPIGVFESTENGDWGGPMHSLEVSCPAGSPPAVRH
jgi:hypothetical protein